MYIVISHHTSIHIWFLQTENVHFKKTILPQFLISETSLVEMKMAGKKVWRDAATLILTAKSNHVTCSVGASKK